MKLSIIIVNYNVQYFLEQCLYSVRKATSTLSAEIIVVDNNSIDGSISMVKNKFPEAILIENKTNNGFSVANNQAIEISRGEYVLLLNPDTLVEEDTFSKTIGFMDQNAQAGGLGVYMIDGSGNFLPESKRGLPTPMVAFYKIFGLSTLFPKSEKFGKYHLGFLDKHKIQQVDVLSGAFMLLRKKTLNEIGLLDEDFFMYGEDIDLSYRIIKGGYKNYYFPETRIIHYKGESTKKSSVNYVFVFYKAMIIFAKKHFTDSNVKLFSFLINLAIYLRASGAIINRFVKRIALPLADAVFVFFGLFFLKKYWENVVKIADGLHFDSTVLTIAFPSYIFIWLISVFYAGGYDKPVRYSKIIKGLAVGTGIILIVYALLSEAYRFSRAILLLGSIWAAVSIFINRLLLHCFKVEGYGFNADKQKRIVLVGESQEFIRVSSLLTKSSIDISYIGNVTNILNHEKQIEHSIGNLEQLEDIIKIYDINEVIFCAKDIPAHKIISSMALLEKSKVEFKIAPPESLYIIGSNSIDNNGELYIININSINKNSNKRSKRLFDVLASVVFFVFSPVLFFYVKEPFGIFSNLFYVFSGKKSWVGYHPVYSDHENDLPVIKPGVLNPLDNFSVKELDAGNIRKINRLYSKDYDVYNDFFLVLKALKHIGRN